jgi:hypothetical protein
MVRPVDSHLLRLHEDGKCIQHEHLVSHLLDPGFRRGAHSGQSLSLRVPHLLGATQVMSRVVSHVMWMFCFMLVNA